MEKRAGEELPYEKFMQKGAESLTDSELLAILLRTGPTPDADAPPKHKACPALALAEKVLAYPKGSRSGLAGLCDLSPVQLKEIRGIGEVKAVRICCVTELARRIALGQRKEMPAFPNPALAAQYCRPIFEEGGSQVEKAVLLLLDGKGKLIHEKVLSIGTVNTALVSPREVFLHAFKYQAVFFMLLHNHPSGDAAPSMEDADITKRLSELGDMMELSMVDHIILGERDYFSFREAGLI